MIEQPEEQETLRSGFVGIIGRPNVGKSTLLNRVLGQKISITSNKPQTTRNRILGICNRPGEQMLFLDTPGIHQARGPLHRYMVEQALSTCGGVDLALYLIEATSGPLRRADEVLERVAACGRPLFLVINKIDQVPRPRLLEIIESYRSHDFAETIPVSALTGEGVDGLLQTIGRYLPEGPRYYPSDQVTDLPERFIVAEFIREKVMRLTRDEIPYGCAVEVESFTEKPEKNLVVIEAVIHVEREAHKRIVIGNKGAMLRNIGSEARKSIEALLGARVFLEVFVRVQKDWTRSERLVRDLGYE
ncbi:GTP-binding protein Era [Geoalkalibacter ferrihydriticus]|uniref:GTPase Era n=2 Tax=Geoalkalibacter ferrihydriticus TaxID=392333 RepID=A0A0C2EFH3_9BACT|nr:GTPase Era [Geoalkalibacter ferrihydriticus]KIH77363.1 GTPase Era [Geoalkalibacter ferrihydriticus DSM 17813]SDM18111.1 GTP-binding protein Era [Geoalkalibacter ferrihydriticus]